MKLEKEREKEKEKEKEEEGGNTTPRSHGGTLRKSGKSSANTETPEANENVFMQFFVCIPIIQC